MNKVYLALGTNKGDRELNLKKAILLLQEMSGPIAHSSDIFVTAPWGNPDQPDFYNQVLCFETNLGASDLLCGILNIEKVLGRVRTDEKWMERTIDIDILFYNEEMIEEENLRVPHPHIQNRKFVLIPLSQIAGDLIHPVLNKTIEQLLFECPDQLQVIKRP